MCNHMDLNDRLSIQSSLKKALSFSEIARDLGRDKATISREVKKHRRFISYKDASTLQTHNACKKRFDCSIKDKCKSPTCYKQYHKNCKLCGCCNPYCSDFEEELCAQYNKPPFVCNGCSKKPRCPLSKWMYDAKTAQQQYEEKLSAARQGICLNEDELIQLDNIVSPLLKKGHSVRSICQNNSQVISISDKTVYKYLRNHYLSADLFDLRRTVQRKPRKKAGPPLLIDKKCREGRTYSDFQTFIEENPDRNIVEMDTVEGIQGGKVILTLFFRNCNLQLGFLRERNTAASVKEIFLALRARLTSEEFTKLFPVILADRGTEFSSPLDIEMDYETGELQTRVFYCDAGMPGQKGGCDRNHEMIRYILPKGKSLNGLTQKEISLMMNHINSYKRERYNQKSPIELFRTIYGTTITEKLGIEAVSDQDICLTPELIR